MKLRTCLFSFCAVAMMAGVVLAQTDGVIYDNGVGATVNTGLSSQLDTLYPFESAVADDFALGATSNGLNWDVTGISFTGLQFNDPPDLPGSRRGDHRSRPG